MDDATLINSIGNLAFPIVMSLLLFFYIKDTNSQLVLALNNNTAALVRLSDYILQGKSPPNGGAAPT